MEPDHEAAPSLLDELAFAPPWRTIAVQWSEHDGEPLACWTVAEERFAVSVADNTIATYERALLAWRESFTAVGSGGLWDHDEAARCAAQNGRRRVLTLRRRPTPTAPPRRPGRALKAPKPRVYPAPPAAKRALRR
jgi:hypothetical protein